MLSNVRRSGDVTEAARGTPRFELPEPPMRLSAVMPVFNGGGWVGRSLPALDKAIARAIAERVIESGEIIVVDDGSTDDTRSEVQELKLSVPLQIVSQVNRGRFVARRTGLDAASGNLVLFIDTRVILDEGALSFVGSTVAGPKDWVWTADVRPHTQGNPIARFWRAIEHVAWRRYHADPRHTAFSLDDFDYYPKGTTAFLCPTELMRAAYDSFEPTVADEGLINDDTALLRYVAAAAPINIAPQYGCEYHARATLRSFMKHAYHRGGVLIDGYMVPGARFNRMIRVVLCAAPLGALALAARPRLLALAALGSPVAGAAGAKIAGAECRDACVFGGLVVPFGAVYFAGMWRGVLSRWRRNTGFVRSRT